MLPHNPSMVANASADDADTDFERFMPTKCESCQIFASELDREVSRLPPKMPRAEAEAWLVDQLEHLCERALAYRLHKEKSGLARFSTQMSGTAKTIQQLKKQGVEVKLDMADELLDRPSIESAKLAEHCEWFLERFEEDIERWFREERGKQSILQYLCHGRFAETTDSNCCQMRREELKQPKDADEL